MSLDGGHRDPETVAADRASRQQKRTTALAESRSVANLGQTAGCSSRLYQTEG
jgi:hypothetical protein